MTTSCINNVAPYGQSSTTQNPQIFSLNYTNQDFWSLKQRLVQFIQERFGPTGTVLPNTFNDFVESSVAIMLIENWAFVADMLSFKTDQIANEIFIDTVTEVENAFRLAQLVGFQPQPPIAASAMFIASINAVAGSDISIPSPFGIDVSSSSGTIRYELFQADSNNNPIFNQDIIIPAGSLNNQSIVGLQGTTIVETFAGTGQAAQSITLGQSPVIYDSVVVYVDGIIWTEVDYFTDSQPRREYIVQFDSNYDGFVIFGNNMAGLIPSNGSVIQVTYRIGGGQIGNIVTGSVNGQTQAIVPSLQFPVAVNFTNYTPGVNGYDGDGIEEIRSKLPLWIQTQNRAVSGNDYKTLTDQFATPYNGQIGKSTAVLRQHGCAGNIVDLYILATTTGDGLVQASDELKVLLNDYLSNIKMMTDYVCIRDGIVVPTDVIIDINLSKFYRSIETELRQNITIAVGNFFALVNWDYGQTLTNINLINAIGTFNQINSIDVSFTTNDPNNMGAVITAGFNEIIRENVITIVFNYT